MSSPPVGLKDSSAWYRALTLRERAASLAGGTAQEVDTPRAARRLQRWGAQAPFQDPGRFAQRLALDGLSVAQLEQLLGEPEQALRARLSAPPPWMVRLASAYASYSPTEGAARARDPNWQMISALAAPLIEPARQRVRQGALALAGGGAPVPFQPEAIEALLLTSLADALYWMADRTLVLELNVARVNGLLRGETPEQRFASFVERLRRPEIAGALLEEYPVLARLMQTRIEQWVEVSLEFLRHLAEDWGGILETFWSGAPGEMGQVVGLKAAGDHHRRGRQVMIVRFSSGLQLVYKPRSLSVDVHFRELVAWLNAREPVALSEGGGPLFRAPVLLERGEHGWVEFITPRGCSTQQQVRRFYQRQGAYLALLYALGATDFHLENLIAEGEHPVLIDLEAFFHPPAAQGDSGVAESQAEMSLDDSVLRVGLLPQRIWVTGASEGVEMSGLGGLPGQLTPSAIPTWEGAGTDAQRLVRKRQMMPSAHNRPSLNGAEVDVLAYAGELTESFTQMYRYLARHRDELLAPGGPLAAFRTDEVRTVLRATYVYSLLLRESLHPDLLRDGLERERYLDRLWLGLEHRPELARIVAFEQESLRWCDIPLFTNSPGSREVLTDSREVLPDFFRETGMGWVERRLQQLGEEDLKRQTWFIQASFTSLAKGELGVKWARVPRAEPKREASKERLLAGARAVGDRLTELALQGTGDASWIGLSLVGAHYWKLSVTGARLYDGVPGIALFLAYLGEVTGEARYTELARKALATLERQMKRLSSSVTLLGAFSGWGGVVYCLAHLGALWSRPELFTRAEELAKDVSKYLPQDDSFDIIGGSAGFIAGLAALQRCKPSAPVLELAVQAGDWLLSHAQPRVKGIGWTSAHSKEPLAGLSHGASGIALALLELSALSGQARFRAAALQAMEYERTVYLPEVRNWPNLSGGEPAKGRSAEAHLTAWCHGAPGVGMGRLRGLAYVDDAAVRQELEIALSTTREQGFGNNHSLCHGDLGNVELLLLASEVLGAPEPRTQAYQFAAAIMDSIDTQGFLCGVPLAVEIPGLMTGIAGIGYELLRLASPRQVPSVLVLEPPRLR